MRLVGLDALILHEAHDEGRLERLRGRMEKEGEQRNPVIVSAHEDRYLVLDGAHRVRALGELGCRLALVQVVEPPGKAESWAHVLGAVGPGEVAAVEGVMLCGEPVGVPLAELRTAGGETLFLCSKEPGLAAQVRALWNVQGLYPEGAVVRRIDPQGPAETPEKTGAVVSYRAFTPEELVEIVRSGSVLPAGITRFRVRERVLGVRYPLKKMGDGDPAGRNAELRRFVEERWEENRVRYYGEPVVLFE